MNRKVLVSVLVLAALAASGYWAFDRFFAPPPPPPQAPAIPVATAVAAKRDVPVILEGLGAVQAYNTVTVHSRVDGQLELIAFKEGQDVKAGDLLARIDPRGFQAALDQALAKKVQDQALLTNTRADLKRYAGLVEKHYVTQQQFDTARNQVAQYEAAVQGDAAAVENARVQLSYTNILAPLDGRVGIRQIDQGNIVHASDAGGIVTIIQIRPISVLFTLPQEQLPSVLKGMSQGVLKVTAFSRDGKQVLGEGVLELVDNQIDAGTGTVKLKATMPNDTGLLWPGQFVNARLLVETRKDALTVPATAILRGQQGAYAYVVGDNGAVQVRQVVSGQTVDSMVVIESGIEAGETVVSEGQFRLQPGARVQVRAADAGTGAGAPK